MPVGTRWETSMRESGRCEKAEQRAPGQPEGLYSMKQTRLPCDGGIGPHPGMAHTWHLSSGPWGMFPSHLEEAEIRPLCVPGVQGFAPMQAPLSSLLPQPSPLSPSLPSPLALLAHPQTPVMWLFPQVLPRDAEPSLTSLGLPPSCHPAFVPPGEAGLCGHADRFFQFVECDGRVQQQQGDIIVHVEFLKVFVQNYACDPLYFQRWAA